MNFDERVSIIICTRRRPTMLHNCLEALRRSVRAPDEVIVVDNSSGDPATESVAGKFHARYVLEEKVGLSHARNRGITESNSEILV